ncbi:MAG: hypothetical protein Q9172_007584 [Xanthocarpia lactea]
MTMCRKCKKRWFRLTKPCEDGKNMSNCPSFEDGRVRSDKDLITTMMDADDCPACTADKYDGDQIRFVKSMSSGVDYGLRPGNSAGGSDGNVEVKFLSSLSQSAISKTSSINTPATTEAKSCDLSISQHAQPATTIFLADSSNENEEERRRAPVPIEESMDHGSTTTQPLRLLDLPLDVLKEITKKAITPWIYERFDLFWPDEDGPVESRHGVDALTYGLATLVMGEPIKDTPTPINSTPANAYHNYFCSHCGELNVETCTSPPPAKVVSQRRRTNHYPQHTRHFMIGNGSHIWIDKYTINKESGMMLGTLVALALARMPNLETFVWNMRTGILRDCWLALGSLGEGKHDRVRSLKSVWVRFHDNSEIVAASDYPRRTPIVLPESAASDPSQTQWSSALRMPPSTNRLLKSYGNVEWPNFSILSALKSLVVLDIDELAYLEEMSVLIHRSIESLRELSVGFSADVPPKGFASSRNMEFPDDHSKLSTYKGALGLLLSKINVFCPRAGQCASGFNDATDKPIGCKHPLDTSTQTDSHGITVVTEPISSAPPITKPAGISSSLVTASSGKEHLGQPHIDGTQETAVSQSTNSDFRVPTGPPVPDNSIEGDQAKATLGCLTDVTPCTSVTPEVQEQKRLRLEVLQLERVNFAFPVLLKTIDWSVLTSLTLLHCDSHERLWKAFRRTYTPRLVATAVPGSSLTSVRRKSKALGRNVTASDKGEIPFSEYRLRLRKLHTNTVSSSLIAFLRETLPPNSLETLFLQDGGMVELDGSGGRGYYNSLVTVDMICRGPLRRHRSSLKKVMIDSSHRLASGDARYQYWRKWNFDRVALSYFSSGKLSALRELSFSMDYKDWHFFLQRLPHIPLIRSMHVHHIADSTHDYRPMDKALALQVMDIVTLRPEVELCYLGIVEKCFEILEGTYNDDGIVSFHNSDMGPVPGAPDEENDEEEEQDEENHNVIDWDDPTHLAEGPLQNGGSDSEDETLGGSDNESECEDKGRRRPMMELREIVFDEAKISIFKARHGKL